MTIAWTLTDDARRERTDQISLIKTEQQNPVQSGGIRTIFWNYNITLPSRFS